MKRQTSTDGRNRDSGAVDAEEQLRTRVAWLYYIEGLTQEQVAGKLGLSRLKVLRTLAACREEGVVQVRINSRLAGCVELERKLEKTFGLAEAVVVPSPGDEADLAQIIGYSTGVYLSENLGDGMTVGVGWGRTLQASLRAIASRSLNDLTIVSLLGGLTHATAVSPSEFAWRFADIFDAECYFVAAPVYTRDEATRDSLFAQKGLREVFDRASRLDMAILSVGDATDGSTIAEYGLIDRDELASLRSAGAVGDVLCHFLKADGSLADHPVNRRVMAFDPTRLAKIPKVVLASGGRHKIPILLTAIALTRASVLITDETTAAGLLARKSREA